MELTPQEISQIVRDTVREMGGKSHERSDMERVGVVAASKAVIESTTRIYAMLGIDLANIDDLRDYKARMNVWSALGYDPSSPEDIKALRSSLAFLARMQQVSEFIASKLGAAILLGIAGAVGWLFIHGIGNLTSSPARGETLPKAAILPRKP